MRTALGALGALLVLVAPAAAAPAPDASPLRLWSLSAIEQGVGKVPLAGDAQPSGALDRSVDLGRVALHPHGFGDHARAEVSSTASGALSFAFAQAPSLDPARPHSAKGGVAQLDAFQAYVKRADDASLRISITGVLLQAIDANGGLEPPQCRAARAVPADPGDRALPRPRLRPDRRGRLLRRRRHGVSGGA
jgi:hypothetical protein